VQNETKNHRLDWRTQSRHHSWRNVWMGVLMRKGVAILFNEKCPCDDCRFNQDCRENDLACRHFLCYIVNGSCLLDIDRSPTHSLFIKIFKDEDLDLRKVIDGQEDLI
jgi:hypothetical protein